MTRSSDCGDWAGSLATVALAGLGGALPAVVAATLSEGAQHLLRAYQAGTPARDLQRQVTDTVRKWASREGLRDSTPEWALHAAAVAVAAHGVSDIDTVRLDYDPARATNVVVDRAKASGRYWGTESYHDVAELAIEVTYAAMYAQLRGNEPTLLPAIRVLRASIIELSAQVAALSDHMDDRLDIVEARLPLRLTGAYGATLRSMGLALDSRLPHGLPDREQDLADIVDFATGSLGYRWLVGGAFTGKTSLMFRAATQALPDTVDVVSYFLQRVASDADSGRFLAAVIPQLAELCRLDAPARDEHTYRSLWEKAVTRAHTTGRHLLLVVDGLDEDLLLPKMASVAALLPNLVAGSSRKADHAHVHVTSRPHPELPSDLTSIPGHPLPATPPTDLTGFPGWAHLRDVGLAEIDALVRDDDLAADLLGLLAAAAGPLSVTDLAAMHTAPAPSAAADRRKVRTLLEKVRSFDQVGPKQSRRFQFAHETLLAHAQDHPDLKDPEFRNRLHAWADTWRKAGWPEPRERDDGSGTPAYLLDTYPSTVRDDEIERLALASDIAWVSSAIAAAGVHSAMATLREFEPGSGAQQVADVLAVVSAQQVNLSDSRLVGQRGYVLRQMGMQALEFDLAWIADAAISLLTSRADPGPIPEWTTAKSQPPRLDLGTHDGPVWAVAILPDGQVATGAADGFVRLWNPNHPGRPSELGRHRNWVQAVDALPDGRIVTGGDDGRVRLWNPQHPGLPIELGRHEGSVWSVAAMSDGRIVTGGDDRRVRLWNPQHPGLPIELGCHDGPVRALTVLPDGRIVTGGDDRRIRLWNPQHPGLPIELGCHDGPVRALTVLPDGRIVTGGAEGRVRLWNPQHPGTLIELGRHDGLVRAIAVLSDGLIATGGVDRQIRLWNPDHPGQGVDLGTNSSEVWAMAVLPAAGGRTIVTGGGDGRIRFWYAETHSGSTDLARHEHGILAVTTLPDGRIVSGGNDRRLLVWNPESPSAPTELGSHGHWIQAMATLPDGRIVSGGNDGRLRLWNPNQPGHPTELGSHDGAVRAVAALPDGRIVSGGDDRRVCLWNPNQPGHPTELGRHEGPVQALTTLRDGRIVSGGDDRRVLLWHPNYPAHGDELGTTPGEIWALATLPDGKIVTGDNRGQVRIWSPDNAGHFSVLGAQDGPVLTLAALPDGSVITGGANRKILFWLPNCPGQAALEVRAHAICIAVANRTDGPQRVTVASHQGMTNWRFARARSHSEIR